MKKTKLIKKHSFFIALFCVINFGFGQTTLAAGDIAITGVNSDDPDQFSFVLLTDVTNGTTINFTDTGWLSTGVFRTGDEGTITWTATSELSCGTQITITDDSPFSATIGAVTDSGLLELSAASGDQLLAYQGLSTSPTFIYAIHFGSTAGWTDATDANTSAVPTGLTNGVNAAYIGDYDNGIYNCTTTSDASLILASVSDINNWGGNNTTRLTLGICTFSCSLCGTETATWDGSNWNWDGGTLQNTVPTIGATSNVIIDGYYDTSIGGIQTSFSACSLTVTNNGELQIGNNTFVEVQNDITVDAGGEISLEPSASVVQIDDLGNVTNNGNIYVYKETAPMNAWYEYTYWSSPVSGAEIQIALPDSPTDRRFKFNGQNFLDATKETANNNVQIVGQDDIDDNNNDWQGVAGNTIMQPGVGYATTLTEFAYNGALGTSNKRIRAASFQGPFNNGVKTAPIYRNDSELADYNWNLIGNPYPSAISADLFLAANSNIATDVISTKSINGAIFLWSQNTPPSDTNNGNQIFNFSNDDYAIINLVGTNAGGDGLTPSRFIPSGQGFFVSMSNSATPISSSVNGDGHTIAQGEIVFNNSMRVKGTTDNSQFFKNTKSKEKSNTTTNKIWVNLTSDNGVFNQILVGYINGATNGDDGISYDTNKFSNKGAVLYSTIEGSNKKFAIQGKDVNSINENETIKLGFSSSITVATLFKLSIAQLEGDFLNSNTVYLKDNLLNKIHNLSASDYTFTSGIGEFNNRFEITFSNKALAVEDVLLNKNALKIIELDNDYVQFKTSDNLNIKSVNIFDLLGRRLYQFKGETTSETYKLSNLNNSIYIAKVALSNGAVITKKAFKR